MRPRPFGLIGPCSAPADQARFKLPAVSGPLGDGLACPRGTSALQRPGQASIRLRDTAGS